jgi:hypothetical protein
MHQVQSWLSTGSMAKRITDDNWLAVFPVMVAVGAASARRGWEVRRQANRRGHRLDGSTNTGAIGVVRRRVGSRHSTCTPAGRSTGTVMFWATDSTAPGARDSHSLVEQRYAIVAALDRAHGSRRNGSRPLFELGPLGLSVCVSPAPISVAALLAVDALPPGLRRIGAATSRDRPRRGSAAQSLRAQAGGRGGGDCCAGVGGERTRRPASATYRARRGRVGCALSSVRAFGLPAGRSVLDRCRASRCRARTGRRRALPPCGGPGFLVQWRATYEQTTTLLSGLRRPSVPTFPAHDYAPYYGKLVYRYRLYH